MIRSTLAAVLFILGLVCLNGIVGNVWVASFQDLYRQANVHRTYVFLLCSIVCFGACGLLMVGGAVQWLYRRAGLRKSRT